MKIYRDLSYNWYKRISFYVPLKEIIKEGKGVLLSFPINLKLTSSVWIKKTYNFLNSITL